MLPALIAVADRGAWPAPASAQPAGAAAPWVYPSPPAGSARDLADGDLWARVVRPVLQLGFRALLRIAFGLRIEGRTAVPRAGAFVLVANHVSHADTPTLVAAVPLGRVNTVHPLGAEDYFFRRRWLGALVRVLLNAVPVDRGSPAPVALGPARELLGQGHGLILYPEGTRSATGEVGRFRQGVGALVAGRQIPVVPAFIAGAGEVLPKGACWPRRGRITVVLGEPVSYEGEADTVDGWRRIAADLERRVRELGAVPIGGAKRAGSLLGDAGAPPRAQ